MIYYNWHNRREIYETDRLLGKGGEGSVYSIKNNRNLVLKEFFPANRTGDRYQKILFMVQHPLKSSYFQAAWPCAVVCDSNSQFVGYTMPCIPIQDKINQIYEANSKYNFRDRVTVAANLCAAIDSVHKAGYVCGDLNPENITANPNTGEIILLDCDSYHVTDHTSGRTFRCIVGRPENLPPEILKRMTNGKTLDKLPLPTFTVESDLFALAEHIFALLMNGCHPFACSSSNPNVFPQPVDNIRNGFAPFFQKQSGLTIPAYAPEISILPKNIQQYFFRAFVDGNKNPKARPTAEEWYTVLREMKNHLRSCSNNSRHIFSDHLSSCPWCKVNSRMNAVNTKPFNSSGIRQTYPHPQPNPQQHQNLQQSQNATPPSSNTNNSSSSNSGCAIFFFIAIVVAGIIFFVMNNSSSNSSNNNGDNNNSYDNNQRYYNKNIEWSSHKTTYKVTWSEAMDYCSKLVENGCSDWRLPNIDELRTLIQNCSNSLNGTCRVSKKYNCLSNNCYYPQGSCYCDRDTTGYYSKYGDTGYFWSSSVNTSNSDYAWGVNFNIGGLQSYYKYSDEYGQARCVKASNARNYNNGSYNNHRNNNNYYYNKKKGMEYDYSATIPYYSELFSSGKEGVLNLPNGDTLYFRYEIDFLYSINFYMKNEDIREKYKVAAVKSLDAEKGYIGKDESYSKQININISAFGFLEMGSNEIFIIIKKK